VSRAQAAHDSPTFEVQRFDVRFDALVAKGAQPEKIIAGHVWLEGPTWDAAKRTLFFSGVEEPPVALGSRAGHRPRARAQR
jgi:hypothetical protein